MYMKNSPTSKNNKPFLIASAFSIAIFGTYLYMTPYFSILGFKTAVESKDTEEARKYINFKSVRRSLKSQLNEALTIKIRKEMEEKPFGNLRMILISPVINTIVDSTIDATVTPNGLNTLLNQGKLTKKNGSISSSNASISTPKQANRVSLYYKSINRFVLKTYLPDIQEPMKIYWKRNSVIKWRLSSIDLPFELMKALE